MDIVRLALDFIKSDYGSRVLLAITFLCHVHISLFMVRIWLV